MPALETDCRFQKAVLWAANGVDNNGQVKVDAAVELDVRWETGKSATAASDLSGTIAFEEVAVVDRVIPVNSIMWLGSIDDIADPPVNLRKVVEYGEIPDIKGREVRRVVGLNKDSNELPTLA